MYRQRGAVWIDNVWCQSNNIENYGFETGDLSDWEVPSTPNSWTESTEYSREGTYSLYSPPGNSGGYVEETIEQKFSLSEIDKPFNASCWVKTEGLTGGVRIEVSFWDADWSESYGTLSSETITGTKPWTKIYVTVNQSDIPNTAVNFKVVLRRLEENGQLWVDDVWCQSNIIKNYGFETGDTNGWDLWAPSISTLWEVTPVYSQEGNYSLYHDSLRFADSNWGEFCYQTFNLDSLQDRTKPFKVSCYVKERSLWPGFMLEVGAEGEGTRFSLVGNIPRRHRHLYRRYKCA
jgi:hypothetical protein